MDCSKCGAPRENASTKCPHCGSIYEDGDGKDQSQVIFGDLFKDKYQSADTTGDSNAIRPQMVYPEDPAPKIKKALIIAAAVLGGLIVLGGIKSCVSRVVAAGANLTQPAQATADQATASVPAEAEQIAIAPSETATEQDTYAVTPAEEDADVAVASDEGPFAPSFDCSRAINGQERMVCDDRELAGLDVALHQAYIVQRGQSNDPNPILESQRKWIRYSFRACSDKACLVQAYNQRIAELGE